MIRVEDFFKMIQPDNSLSKDEYNVVSAYIKVLDAYARGSYQSAYLIDYQTRSFLFVSDNQIFLCGHSSEEVKNAGYEFYLKQVPKKDLELLVDINIAGFQFYESLNVVDRLSYSITYDFHMIQKDGSLLLINHSLTPLEVRDKGQIWLALCIVSISSNHESGNVFITSKKKEEQYSLNISTRKWRKENWIQLSEKEKKVLMLSAQGFTNDKISAILFASIDTIKLYKRKIFDKLDVNNISEAIAAAINRGLL